MTDALPPHPSEFPIGTPVPHFKSSMITITCQLTPTGGEAHVIVVAAGETPQGVPGWRARVSLYEDEATASCEPLDALEGLCHALLEAVKAWDAVHY